MKNLKQVFPIVFVLVLAVGLFFIVRANDRQTEMLAESSSQAAEQAKTTINTEDTTLVSPENSDSNNVPKGKDVKYTKKIFSITQKSNKVKYPVTAVITAKRVVKYFFDDLEKKFQINDKLNRYYKQINNDKIFKNNTIFLTIAEFENSNSKYSINSVKYNENQIYIDIIETKAKKPNKEKCRKVFAVKVADKDCNAKAVQKINVNILKK